MSLNRIALFTTSFNGIDGPKPLPPNGHVDTYFVTDRLAATDEAAAGTWTHIAAAAPASRSLAARMRARYHKTQIHRLSQAAPYRWLAWADASLQFRELDFVAAAVARLEHLPADRRLLLVPHPERRTVREEYAFVRSGIENGIEYLRSRYRVAELTAQMEHLAARKMNTDGRLWATGFFLVEKSDRIGACWDSWWDHIRRFGVMDQLPLPPLLEKFGLAPEELSVNIFSNAHFSFIAHRAPTE